MFSSKRQHWRKVGSWEKVPEFSDWHHRPPGGLIPPPFSTSTTSSRRRSFSKKRRVHFNTTVCLVLIPTREEMIISSCAGDVWWSREECAAMKASYMTRNRVARESDGGINSVNRPSTELVFEKDVKEEHKEWAHREAGCIEIPPTNVSLVSAKNEGAREEHPSLTEAATMVGAKADLQQFQGEVDQAACCVLQNASCLEDSAPEVAIETATIAAMAMIVAILGITFFLAPSTLKLDVEGPTVPQRPASTLPFADAIEDPVKPPTTKC